MGLTVYVYKCPLGDCTNGGISSKYDSLTVVNVKGPSEPREYSPAVLLVTGPYNTARLVPAVFNDLSEKWESIETAHGEWVMFGGNFGSTSDSRFSEAIKLLNGDKNGIVKIFDRIE